MNPIPNHIRRGDTVAFMYSGAIRIVANITIFKGKNGSIYLKGQTAEGVRCYNGNLISNIRAVPNDSLPSSHPHTGTVKLTHAVTRPAVGGA